MLYTDYYDYCYSVDPNNDTGLCVQMKRQALSFRMKEAFWRVCLLSSPHICNVAAFLKWQRSECGSIWWTFTCTDAGITVAILQANENKWQVVTLSALVCSYSPGLLIYIFQTMYVWRVCMSSPAEPIQAWNLYVVKFAFSLCTDGVLIAPPECLVVRSVCLQIHVHEHRHTLCSCAVVHTSVQH